MNTRLHGVAYLRALTGLIVLSVVLVLIWAPGLTVGFGALITVFVLQGMREFYGLARGRGLAPAACAGTVAGTLVALSALACRPGLTASALCVSAVALCVLHVLQGGASIADMAASVFGVLYVGWFGAHVVLLHGMPGTGPGLVTVLFVLVALTDTGAYTVGSWLGKHKMAPKVSPNKTWEGALGGFILGIAGMAVLHALARTVAGQVLPDWGLGRYLAIGAALSVVAQLGDLTESALKRDAGVKDSGAIFPGHGGMLDRCDSYLFAAPALYYLIAPCGGM